MLKTGLYFLFASSLGVLYRNPDYAFGMNPALKWACFAGLTCALICFIGTYLRTQAPELLKVFTHRHMIKSPAWKASSIV